MEGPNRDSPMTEMFELFPQESAIVMQRGIELGIVCSCVLVIHCCIVMWYLSHSDAAFDRLMNALCFIRILFTLPRPHFWLCTRRLFMAARYQPTPRQVTQRLLYIYSHPFQVERNLLLFYYGWLAVTSIAVFFIRYFTGATALVQQMWWHCILNFFSIVLHRFACVLLFYYLMSCDFKGGIPLDVLNNHSKRLTYGHDHGRINHTDAECSICMVAYAEGEEIRQLGCGHHFHQKCVDVWLLEHQSRCPLCLKNVGP